MTTETTTTTRPAGTEGLCGYVGFFEGKRHEFYAASLFAAKQQAIAHFKPSKKKEHMVSVVLAEKPDGTEVVHTPDF